MYGILVVVWYIFKQLTDNLSLAPDVLNTLINYTIVKKNKQNKTQ